MNQDELNNLLNVMQKKISELTTQNIMLEAKVIYLTNKINSTQATKDSDGFSPAEEIKEPAKTRR
jgi:cell division septum initiation protein DivIVA